MKNKLLSLLLASAMCVSVCACGNNPSEESQEVAGTQATVESSTTVVEEVYVPTYPIVEEPITIRGLVVGRDTSKYDNRLVWEEVAKITNINIEWECIDAEALSTYLAGGDWPDIIHHTLSAAMVNDYGVIGGKFVNYLDYLDIMPNLAKCYEDYPQALSCSTQLNGEVYNLPKVSGQTATSTSSRAYFRMDVLEEAGINKMPTTIDEFYDSLVALKEHNGVPGFVLKTNSPDSDWYPMLYGAFGTLTQINFADDGTGKVVFGRTSEQMKHFLEFLNKLYEEELMNREYLTLDATALQQIAGSGKYAYLTASAAQKIKDAEIKDGNWDYLQVCAPLTSEYDSTQEIVGYLDYADGGMYLNAESEYIEEICKMLDIAYATEEVVEGTGIDGHAFVYGIEGVDYIINDDGTYEQLVREGYGSFSEVQYGRLVWMNFGRSDKFGLAVTSTPGNAQARQFGFVKNTIPYQADDKLITTKALKFTDDENYVLGNKYGEIDSYCKQMEAEFISGSADIETKWDEYVSTVEKMGIADVLKVYQSSYDRYRAAQEAIKK